METRTGVPQDVGKEQSHDEFYTTVLEKLKQTQGTKQVNKVCNVYEELEKNFTIMSDSFELN